MTKKKNVEKTIIWKETAGIEFAEKLKAELVKAFDSYSDIRLDLSALEDIDITGIQLIVAARKEAEKEHKSFYITGTIPPSIAAFTAAGGMSLVPYTIPQAKTAKSEAAQNIAAPKTAPQKKTREKKHA